MKTLTERLETPVREETDVLVVGGGIAGVAAALAARRAGAAACQPARRKGRGRNSGRVGFARARHDDAARDDGL